MAHSEICPICSGKGKVDKNGKEETCHGCGGSGWITVQDTTCPYPVYPIYPQYPYYPTYPPYSPWVTYTTWGTKSTDTE
jgi:hypothetical protein